MTILCARLHVGDLAERIAAQTGLPITADDGSGAADRRIMVSVRDVPAWKVMAGLTGLLSYKMALWQWERTGDTGAAEYRLVRTRGAQSLAQRLAEQAQSEFEDLAFRRMRDTYRTAQQWTERLADPTPVTIEERSGWGLQMFNATLPEDAQKSVLRGEVKARVPTSRLPPWGKRLVEDLYNRGRPWRRLPDGSTAPAPFPEDVMAYTSYGRDPTPTLFLEMGDMGGYGYCGGNPLAEAFRKKAADASIGDGDLRESAPLEKTSMAGAERHELQKHGPFDPVWVDLAEQADVPLIALAPVGRESSSFSREGATTLGGYLHSLHARDHAIHKWRNRVLLITYAGWFRDAEEVHSCPWAMVRQLRDACRANGGFPTLEALVRTAADLSPEQLAVLSDDWPPADSLIGIRSALRFLDGHPDPLRELRDKGSVTLTGPSARAAAASLAFVNVSDADRSAVAVQTTGASGDSHLAVQVFAYDRSGNLLGGRMPRFPIWPPWAPISDQAAGQPLPPGP